MTNLVPRPWARLSLVARLSLAVALSIVLVSLGAAYQSARHVVRTAQDDLTAKYTEQMDTLESLEQKVHAAEHALLSSVIARLSVDGFPGASDHAR